MQRIIIGKEYPRVVGEFVRNAKKSIKILIYDWRWYKGEVGTKIQKFNREIINATKRGVKVEALVNIEVIKSQLRGSKIKIKKVDTKKTMHAKMLIVDDRFLILGSHNLTKNAFEINHEVSVVIDDSLAVSRCVEFFNNLGC